MGRPALNITPVLVRLPADMPDRIDALVGKQKRAAFIREAIERELARREAEAKGSG
jgi:predicted DNA-binding protein